MGAGGDGAGGGTHSGDAMDQSLAYNAMVVLMVVGCYSVTPSLTPPDKCGQKLGNGRIMWIKVRRSVDTTLTVHCSEGGKLKFYPLFHHG